MSLVETEAPETPAPLFAFRAFRTALFGTPYAPNTCTPVGTQKASQIDTESKAIPSLGKAQATDGNQLAPAHLDLPKTVNRLDRTPSPSKGILLTPGVGTSRRKNVSFVQTSIFEDDEGSSKLSGSPTRTKVDKQDKGPPSRLTQTLLALSTQHASQLRDTKSETLPAPRVAIEPLGTPDIPKQLPISSADQTVDLSAPKSLSGRYWKDAYNSYYLKSDREMKKIIKHGQGVRSFAVKKDTEASRLLSSLHVETKRAQALEVKLQRMAHKLEESQAREAQSGATQARLTSELAQQSRATAKYREKVDQYRASIVHQSSANNANNGFAKGEGGGDGYGESQIMPELDMTFRTGSQPDTSNAESDDVHETLAKANAAASRLESENAMLRQSLAKIRGEMKSYESRRQARETRLEREIARHKREKDEARNELARLTIRMQALQVSNPSSTPRSHAQHPTEERSVAKHPSPIDIWTIEPAIPVEPVQNSSPVRLLDRKLLPPSSVSRDVHKVLGEIDLNLAGQRSRQVDDEKVQRVPVGYEDGRSVYASSVSARQSSPVVAHRADRPHRADGLRDRSGRLQPPSQFRTTKLPARQSLLSVHSSPAKVEGVVAASDARICVPRFTPARCMTEERAAAARARLARRSVEKKRSAK